MSGCRGIEFMCTGHLGVVCVRPALLVWPSEGVWPCLGGVRVRVVLLVWVCEGVLVNRLTVVKAL